MNGSYYNTYEKSNNISQNNHINELYLDNILLLNKGKKIKLYISIPGTEEYQNKVFNGVLEHTGKDHIIISNPENGLWSIIPIIYLVYIDFEEPINYNNHFYN